MDYTALGRRIKEERFKMHMTQEQLAEDINISTSYMGQIERGERHLTLDTLMDITNRLGVTVDYLLRESVSGEQLPYKEIWSNLLSSATEKEREMVINMTKLFLNYTHE